MTTTTTLRPEPIDNHAPAERASCDAVRISIALRWRDLDVLGHVYQGRYHEFLDEARAAVFAAVTGPQGFPFVLANVTLDYRHEVLRTDEVLHITTAVAEIGRSRVVLEHRIAREDGTAVATGRSTLVAWDRDGRQARPLSDQERAALDPGIGREDGHEELTREERS